MYESENLTSSRRLSPAEIAALQASRSLLKSFRKKYRGKRCFIVADTSGVREPEVTFLRNEIVFCLDDAYPHFEKMKITPSFYVCSDWNVFNFEVDHLSGLSCPKFMTIRNFDLISEGPGCCFLYASSDKPPEMFIKDPTVRIAAGQTASFIAMELAYFMGFSQVFLLGPVAPIQTAGNCYLGEKRRENLPATNLEDVGGRGAGSLEATSEKAIKSAKYAFESDGRILVDVTPGGSTAVLPKTKVLKIAEVDRKIALKCNVPGRAIPPEPRHEDYEMLVSAIVSTYNSERYITDCLEDLEHQTIANRLEVIVVISGSQQGEEHIVNEFRSRYDNIRVIKTEARETVYQAWNRGIKAARGKYLTNANTDDRHSPEAFEKMAGALEADPSKVLVYIDQKYFRETGERAREFMFDRDRGPFSRNRLLDECFIGSQPMWRADIHDEYGFFDEAFFTAGDYEFWLRIAQNHPFHHLNELLGERLIRGDSLEYDGNSQLSYFESAVIQKSYEYAVVYGIPVTRLGLSRHPVFSEWCELNLIMRNTRSRLARKPIAQHSAAGILYDDRVPGAAPQLSIVITTFNRKDDLLSNLRALSQQICMNFETIVVNNGDSIAELAGGQLKLGYPYCYMENPCNYGPSHARNLGVLNSRSEIVAILDDDAIADSGWVQAILGHFATDSIAALRGRVRPKSAEASVHIPVNYDLGDAVLFNTAGLEMNTAFRRDLFLELGGYDEFMFGYEGAELSYRIFMASHQRADCIKYYPDVTIFHDYTDNPERLFETQLRLKAMKKLANKKWPGLAKYISMMWGMIPANQNDDDYARLIENALFCFQGSPQKSAVYAAKAISIKGTEPLGFVLFGDAMLKMGDYKTAKGSFELAARLLGQILRCPEMEPAFRQSCVQLRRLSYEKLAQCLEATGNVDKARQIRDQAKKLDSQNARPQSDPSLTRDILKRSQERLAGYKQCHQGQRCVIIGNGPSLNKMDLSFLENETTFGMNRIYLMFPKWNFRPTYYVSVNPLVLEQSAAEILKIEVPKFLSHKGIPFIPDAPEDVMFIRSIPKWVFSTDPRNGLCEGWTVTYFALQLAYYMGFEEVILIGVDHHFVTQGDPNKEVVSEGDDPNHFHPGYFGKGVRWQLPDLVRSEKSYRMAKQAFEAAGRRILDATVDGHLKVFPKVDYRQHFARASSAALSSAAPHEPTVSGCLREARILTDCGKPADALALLKKAVNRIPAEAALHFAAGVLSAQCDSRREAVPFFEAAVKLDASNPTYLNGLAWCYHEGLGRSADALDLLKKALLSDRGRQETCRSISRILYSVGQPESAQHFERMAAGQPMPVT